MPPTRYKNKTYIQNNRIAEHLGKVAEENGFNRFLTLSFVYSGFGTPLRKHDVLLVSNRMRDYFNEISHKLNGRPRKSDKQPRPKIPAMGFPEYKSKTSGSSHLHYHCLIRIPDEQIEFFERATKDFWKRAIKNTIGYAPQIDNKGAYNPKGAAFYSNKNIEDGFTLENTVYCGINLS